MDFICFKLDKAGKEKHLKEALKTHFSLLKSHHIYAKDQRDFIVAMDEKNDIVGILCYSFPSQYNENAYAFNFIETRNQSKYLNKGISSAMMNYFYEHVLKTNPVVFVSAFEPDGWVYLYPQFKKLKEKGVIVSYYDEMYNIDMEDYYQSMVLMYKSIHT